MPTFVSSMPIRGLRSAIAFTVCLLLAGCARIGLVVANIGVDSRAITTVRFDRAHALSLDVHRPVGAVGKAPVVVFFYGGSWRNSTREDYRFVGQSLARAGLLVVVPDYRKAPQVSFPAFIEDGARAVAWTRQHAAEYGGDPARIYLMGHSSGAHIAAMLGTDGGYLDAVGMKPRDLAGVIGLAGPYDFLPLTDPDLKEVFGRESDWPKSQPVNFVDGDEPPFLLLQGSADTLVMPRNAPRLAAKLQAAHEPVELRMFDGVGHAGLLIDLLRDASPVRADVLGYIDGRRLSAATAPPR
ncbi:MAG TPA: alpha/beta hydrolase [Xanthomonadaceae bacterium]|nr:alpha/beta hydrolase [Xanthomonadaceae bacterium]